MMLNENRDSLAPENPIYKGKHIFRWDDSPGLDHHCGNCATPLHNSRAKTSCIGKHVEPCYRFHQQLHLVGRSQDCFSCTSADEMHHKRHKEILQLVRKISEIDNPDDTLALAPAPRTSDLGRSARDDPVITTSTLPVDPGSGSGSSDSGCSTKARKKVRLTSEATPTKLREVEIFPREDFNFISYALHKMRLESKGACAGTYSYPNPDLTTIKEDGPVTEGEVKDAARKAPKAHKVGNKSFRKTRKVKGFNEKQLHEMTPRQRRDQVFAVRRGGHSRKYNPESVIKSDLYGGVDPEIFFSLGVEVVNPPVNSRERKSLVSKLVAVIKTDLSIQVREEEERHMREQGFWRWAGKSAYNHMTRSREGIDWATGMKIESFKAAGFIEDDEDGDDDNDEDYENVVDYEDYKDYEDDGDDEATLEQLDDDEEMEAELGFDVMATPTLDSPPAPPVKTPVKVKCYAPILRIIINTDKSKQEPREIVNTDQSEQEICETVSTDQSEQTPCTIVDIEQPTHTPCKPYTDVNTIVPFGGKVFAQASCARAYGKPILYSKAISTSLPSSDQMKDFAVRSCNLPAEVFTQKEDVNDDQGWETVGKRGKPVPVVTAEPETTVATRLTT